MFGREGTQALDAVFGNNDHLAMFDIAGKARTDHV